LRLGLGQVLRYRQLLERSGQPVQALLMVEREPRDGAWRDPCDLDGSLVRLLEHSTRLVRDGTILDRHCPG